MALEDRSYAQRSYEETNLGTVCRLQSAEIAPYIGEGTRPAPDRDRRDPMAQSVCAGWRQHCLRAERAWQAPRRSPVALPVPQRRSESVLGACLGERITALPRPGRCAHRCRKTRTAHRWRERYQTDPAKT